MVELKRIEVLQARAELERAWDAFEWADESHKDVAILRLTAAEEAYSVALRAAKESLVSHAE
jgi:hypothetical protein